MKGRFGRKRAFDRFSPKPVDVGEEYDVVINEVGSRGDGIARIKNFVVFVPDTRKGDSIRIKVTEIRNTCAIGKKISVAEEKKEEVTEEEKVEAVEKSTEEKVTEEEKKEEETNQ